MIQITTLDGLCHTLESQSSIDAYSTSINTRTALREACAAGHWQPYTPPVPQVAPPPPPPPDWKTFRLDLLKGKSFRVWSELLPGTWREDLKMAALVGNAEALQDIYNYCKSISLPLPASTSEWQRLADKSNIPVKF